MITVTCVRHGESTDNLAHVWAGWKDAPLSTHGMNQARAAGQYFASVGTKAHIIYASPLKRAYTTAEQILASQSSSPKPALVSTESLKEQFWGDAEGHPFTWGNTSSAKNGGGEKEGGEEDKDSGVRDASGKYSPLTSRTSRFPNGESSNDVALRVDKFISEYILPHLLASLPDDEGMEPLNVFVVSHGIAIAELIGAFLRRDPVNRGVESETWRGLVNTGWTRLVVGLRANEDELAVSQSNDSTSNPSTASPAPDVGSLDTGAQAATILESAHPPPTTSSSSSTSNDPPLSVKIVAVNQRSHLEGVKRQKGGIGSSAYDPQQASIKDFFGGGGGSSKI